METYRLQDAVLTVDVGGTAKTIECSLTSLGLVRTPNFAEHPRTGCARGYSEYVDDSIDLELGYAQSYGADGIHTAFAGLAGTEVQWQIETGGAGVASVDYPVFTFDAVVPNLSELPTTEWGEFAAGDITIPVKGDVTMATTAAVAASTKAGKA